MEEALGFCGEGGVGGAGAMRSDTGRRGTLDREPEKHDA